MGLMTGLGTPDGHKLHVKSCSGEKRPQEWDHPQYLKRSYLPIEEVFHGKLYEIYLYFQMQSLCYTDQIL